MALRQDQVQVNVEINGAQAGENLKQIKANVNQLNRELQLLTPGSEAANKKIAEIAQAKRPLDETRDAINAVSKSLKDSADSGGFFKNAISSALGVFTGGALLEGAQAIFSGIKGFLTDSVAASNEAVTGANQLTQALDGNVEASERLQGQAGALQKSLKGLFDDDDIIAAQTRLGLYTNEAAEIEKLTPQILDLASAKGIDLVTAAEAVGKSLSGNADGLKKLGISVKDAGSEEERLKIISEGLTAAVGGQAEVVANSGTSGWQRLKNTFGEVQETIGGKLAPFISKLGDFLSDLLDKSQPVIDVFKGVFNVFGEVWTQVKNLVASFGLFNDKTSIADLVIKALTTGAKFLGSALQAVGSFIASVIKGMNEMVAVGSGTVSVLTSVFSGFKDFFLNVFSNIGGILKGVFTLDLDEIKSGVAGLKNVYSDFGTQVRTAYDTGYNTVKDRQKAADDQEFEAETAKQVAKVTERAKKLSDKEVAQLKKDAADKLKAQQDLAKQLEELSIAVEDARINAMRDGIQKDIAVENVRYAREQEAFTQRINRLRLAGAKENQIAEENANFRESAELEHSLKLVDINQKYQDKKLAEEKKTAEQIKKDRESDFQSELESVNAYYDGLIAGIRKKEAALAEASAAGGGSPEELQQIAQGSADAILLIEITKNQELLNLNQEFGKSTLENESAIADQRIAFAQRTADQKAKAEAAVKNTIKDGLDFAIEALGRDEEARKKNAGLIRAFSVAKISVNLAEELSGIFSRANQNYLNALIPGSGNIIGGIQAAIAVGRAAANLATVSKAQFAGGGPTGKGIGPVDNTGHRVAGIVHANEWVSPQWMTEHPIYGQVIHQLEDARVKGFADGGFTTTPAAGLPVATGAFTEGVLLRLADAVENMPKELKARVTYTDIESIENDVTDVRGKASIG